MIEFRNNDKAKINATYKPPTKIAEDRYRVYERYHDMKIARAPIEPEWDKAEKDYEAWRPPKNTDDWQSTIVPPFTTTIVERALAEMVDQTIQPMIVARGDEDQIRARIMNYIRDYTWEIGDGDLNLYSSLKQSLVLGKTIWQEDYWQDKRKVKVLKKFDMEKNIEEYIEKTVYDFDDVYGETVNIRDFFIDGAARTINMGRYKANDCIRRYIMNFDTFQENFIGSIYDQFGVAKLVKPGGDTNYYQYYQPPKEIDSKNQVEVLFYWGRRPDKCIIVANDVVIKDGPNYYNHKQLPFAEGSDVPRLNQFWAKGEPKLLESIQDELTTMRRMRIDRQHMDLFKMFMVSNRENLDDDEGIVAPSRFLYVDDPTSSIKALEYGPVSQTAYQEEAALKEDGRQVTGMASPQPTGTATEAAIFKESTMKALRMKIWLASRELLTNITRLRVPNISQFYTTPKINNILGETKASQFRTIRTTDTQLKLNKDGTLQEQDQKGQFFFTITPDMVTPFYGAFDYKLSGEPTFPLSKPLQQQKVAEFMQHPVIQAAVAQGYYEVGKLADSLSDINDFDPTKFKPTNQTGDQQDQAMTEEQLLELANRENQLMLQGQPIHGTPYATRSHTDVHLAFMDSQPFKDAVAQDKTILQIFANHISFEGTEQEQRAAGAGQTLPGVGQPSQTPGSVGAGILKGQAAAAQPGKVQGAETAPPPPMNSSPMSQYGP